MSQFKEQLFIALATVLETKGANAPIRELAQSVQETAKTVCEVWGHDEELFYLATPGAATIANPYRTYNHKRCRRCGEEVCPTESKP